MNLEQSLEKIVEHAHEELRIVRKRAEQKTAASSKCNVWSTFLSLTFSETV